MCGINAAGGQSQVKITDSPCWARHPKHRWLSSYSRYFQSKWQNPLWSVLTGKELSKEGSAACTTSERGSGSQAWRLGSQVLLTNPTTTAPMGTLLRLPLGSGKWLLPDTCWMAPPPGSPERIPHAPPCTCHSRQKLSRKRKTRIAY